ncbi:MAG TPA: LysE family translocator [Telluria sp.]|nr:LysE family translocator [Telluria sp.]
MDWNAFGLFLLTNFVLSLTPGPAVLLVTGHAAANGWRRSQSSVLGIMSGNAAYCLLSAFGLGALFVRFPALVGVVKGVGAAYLVFIGVRALLLAGEPLATGDDQACARPVVLYRQALALQLSNPKSVLFFCALLPQFVNMEGPSTLAMLVLGACAIVLEYPVLTAYSILGAQARRLAGSPTALHTLNVLAAGLLLLAAGRVAAL